MSRYSQIKKIISENFPGSKIRYIQEFPEGYNNIAYDVKLDLGNYVIKILKVENYIDYALKQNKIRTLISKKFKDFPIAKIIKFDLKGKLIGKPYLISEKIEGKSLKISYNQIKNKRKLFEEIGEIYGKMHSFKFTSYGELDSKLYLVNQYESWYRENCKKINNTFKKISEGKLLPKKTFEKNKILFDDRKSLLKKEVGPRLCHGDASLTNILIKNSGKGSRVSGIIDFEFVRSGGVVQDLFSGLRSPDMKYNHRRDIVRGYTKWAKLPLEWEDLANFYKWANNLNRLTKINGMSWRGLNNEKTILRKKNLRKEALLSLNKLIKKF